MERCILATFGQIGDDPGNRHSNFNGVGRLLMELSKKRGMSGVIAQPFSSNSVIGKCKNASGYEKAVRGLIRAYKQYFGAPGSFLIPLYWKGERVGRLRPVPTELKGEASKDAVLQTDWRNLHKDSFLAEPFIATVERTKGWLEKTYYTNDDVIIFIIEAIDGTPVGHLGFSSFDYKERMCEFGRLMRGAVAPIEKKKGVNLIERAERHFLKWGFDALGLKKLYGRQFSDNRLVWRIHEKCGFYITEKFMVPKGAGERELIRVEVTKDKFIFG